MSTAQNPLAYLIDSFEIHIAVAPIDRALTNPQEVTHGVTRRWVKTDNRAWLTRRVCFSRKNKLTAPFRFLRYQTQNGGAIRNPTTSGRNEADAFEMGRYADTGIGYVYQLTPTAGATYELEFELLKGFDRYHRHAHFHLPRPARMRQVVLTLNLERYFEADFHVSQDPILYLHEEEPFSHDFCAQRGFGNRVAARRGEPIWEWVVPDLTGGVVDVCWDLVPPSGFEEVQGPAVAQGLEQMAADALAVKEELQLFYLIGRLCLTRGQGGVFSCRQVAKRRDLPGVINGYKDVSRAMDQVTNLFRNYFQVFGYLPDRVPFDLAPCNSEEPEDEKRILMRRRHGTKPQICLPVGRWAWELTKEFLLNRGLLQE